MGWLEGATIRPSGEAAFVIEYGDAIDQAVGQRVAALFAALETAAPEGFVEAVPTFRSLLVLFDPDITTQTAILAALPDEAAGAAAASAEWIVPACFDADVAEDLDEAAKGLDMPPDTVRERLAASHYQVGMYGFAPGYAYLSGIDQTLTLAAPARSRARRSRPAASSSRRAWRCSPPSRCRRGGTSSAAPRSPCSTRTRTRWCPSPSVTG